MYIFAWYTAFTKTNFANIQFSTTNINIYLYIETVQFHRHIYLTLISRQAFRNHRQNKHEIEDKRKSAEPSVHNQFLCVSPAGKIYRWAENKTLHPTVARPVVNNLPFKQSQQGKFNKAKCTERKCLRLRV